MLIRAASVFALLLALPIGEARALEATLTVSTGSSLVATFDAIDIESAPVLVSGDVEVAIDVVDDANFGTIPTSVYGTSGRLTLGDLAFGLVFGTHVSLQLSSMGISAAAGGPMALASATGPGSATVVIDGFNLLLDTGTATTTGTVFGSTVSDFSDFEAAPGELRAAGGTLATITTSGPVTGPVAVTVTIPVDALLLAVEAPLQVPMKIEGQLVLTGTAVASPPVPVLHRGWLAATAALLLVTGYLAWLRRAPPARARARSPRDID